MNMSFIINHISKLQKVAVIIFSLCLNLLIGLLDVATGVELSVSLFYLIPITINSWFVSKWSGVFFSLLSTVTWLLIDLHTLGIYSHVLVPYWNALVLFGFFITISLMLSFLRGAVDREKSLAIKVQQGLLPKQLPNFKNFEISVVWKPKSFVSGDYYDFVKNDNESLGVCIGDVAGHGVSAALLMSNLQGAFRLLAHQDTNTSKTCYQLNNALMENEIHGKFVTFFYAVLNQKNKSMVFTNAGHPPPIIVDSEGNIKKLESGGLMIGVASNQEYSKEIVQLASGDRIILYTDGLLEAKNIKGELFGENRFINACLINRSLPPEKMAENIIQKVTEFCTGIFDDDITLIILSHH